MDKIPSIGGKWVTFSHTLQHAIIMKGLLTIPLFHSSPVSMQDLYMILACVTGRGSLSEPFFCKWSENIKHILNRQHIVPIIP
jgi:hypothetical protein